MTILEALNSIDALQPNAIPEGQKMVWLAQLEGMVRSNILCPWEALEESAFAQDMEAPMTVPPPWDSIYLHWLAMQIHYVQGETDRYNQANALFRTLWGAYRDYYNRTHLPEKRSIHYA